MGAISTKNKDIFLEFRKTMLDFPKEVRDRALSPSHAFALLLPFSYRIEVFRHYIAKLLKNN